MLEYISSLYMLDSLCPYIVQLTFLRTRTSLFLGNWESQMQPNMFPICIFYFHALSFKLTDIYVLVWIQKMCTYYRVWPRTVIVNYILCMYMHLNCTMHCLIIVQNILEPCSVFIKTIFKYKLSFKKWNHPIKNDTCTSKTL